MSARWPVWMAGGALALVVALLACAQEPERALAPAMEERTVTFSPAPVPVRVDFLAGQLDEVRVTARVEPGSDSLVDPPVLRARLKLKNASRDQAAQLVSGRIEYVDRGGKPIPVEEDGGTAAFNFWEPEWLDPGTETTESIEVPFPAGALKQKNLGGIRLDLTYLAIPYRPEAAFPPRAVGVPLRPWEELWY